MFGLEMTGFVEPQPRAIDRHQKGAMFGMRAADGEEPFEFHDAINLRAEDRLAGEGQRLVQALDLTVEHVFVQEAEGTDRLVDGAGGQLAFLRQMQQVRAHLFVGELIGRLVKELGQLIGLLHVSFLRPIRATAQHQFFEELLA